MPGEDIMAQVSQFSDEPPSILSFTARQFTPTYFYAPFVAMGPAPITEAKISINGKKISTTLQLIPYSASATGYPVGTAGILSAKSVMMKIGDKMTLTITDGLGNKTTSRTISCKNLGGKPYCY